MPDFYNIIIKSFQNAVKKYGFWFTVVCLGAYLLYDHVPKILVWFVEREDAQLKRLERELSDCKGELHDCDSVSRSTTLRLVDEMKDFYKTTTK